jgi:hypothetical protein
MNESINFIEYFGEGLLVVSGAIIFAVGAVTVLTLIMAAIVHETKKAVLKELKKEK